eukprot:TRINITY_DN63992_c0_g1_i1.p1 TRINITY_DN63992_c0_g1~~TRINITY_DN63992_c0_g1_i1.p1  ORF type:complete len:505 (+),score=62.83 TRINITY_DN63992_c0_g1_i1:39-1517(+)
MCAGIAGMSFVPKLFRLLAILSLFGREWVCADAVMNFTVVSQPIELRYGEVYNRLHSEGPWTDHLLPRDVIQRYADGKKQMAITGFTLDMIRRLPDGSESRVKLSDHYLHHYILYFGRETAIQHLVQRAINDPHLNHMLTGCHGMRGMGLRAHNNHLRAAGASPADIEGVGFGSAAGAEYRHNEQRFEAPFRLIVAKPEVWLPTFHIINTKDDARTVSPLLECPCTPQRMIDPAAGTIDGKRPDPHFGCSENFAATGNAACNLSTYKGGWRCCEHDMFLVDTSKECRFPDCREKTKDKVFMQFTFSYEDATPETRNLEPGACCDTTSDGQGFGNIEHDVPACPKGTPVDECLYVTESVQPVAYFYSDSDPQATYGASDLVDLVFASPHLHWAGISIELIDDATNKTLCEVHRSDDGKGGVLYGNSSEAGNENGYLVGLTTCIWGPAEAPRFKRSHLLRARSVYNATEYHTGVMSLWLTNVAAVKANSTGVFV